jgi:hypothetical protein
MPDIGGTLREARMRSKIDISEVELETKIRAKYLRALENEEWELLPGPTFVKSFLRTYADYLGLDGKLLIEEYKSRHEGPSDIDLIPITSPGTRLRSPGKPRVNRAWMAGVLIAALLALFAYLGSRSNHPPAVTTGAGTPASHTHHRAGHAAAPRLGAAGNVRLELAATAPVWVCLQDAHGRRVLNGQTLTPGGVRPRFVSRAFRVLLGNGNIQLRINGRALQIAPSQNPVGYRVGSQGLVPLPPGKRPTCA